jgi:hypothetical protein
MAMTTKDNKHNSAVTREAILQALRTRLEPLEFVHAMWEGGAASFRRLDEWSDIDIHVDVDDQHVADVFEAAAEALSSLAPIELVFAMPEPTWHGHSQRFYRLDGISKFLVVDLAVMKHSNPDKFIQHEIHGDPMVHFDKSNVVRSAPLDHSALAEKLHARLGALRTLFDLFQVLTLKELNRRNTIEALAFYQSYTLRPLVEALRIKYKPTHHDFNTRYLYYDLPAEVVRELEDLYFVANADDLLVKRQRAESLFYATLDQLDGSELAL